MKHVGLSSQEALTRQKQYGLNLLPEDKPHRAVPLIVSQIANPLIYILFLVIAISLFFGEVSDAILISMVIVLNVTMGFIQEYSAQKTLYALRQVVKSVATVFRDGSKMVLDSTQLVPGDLVIFGVGDTIPADGEIVDGVDVLVNEAIITGESEPVKKNTSKENRVLMGSTVLAGRGVFKVSYIGTKTEVGKIGKSLVVIKDVSTPLQKKLSQFSKSLILLTVAVSIIIFILGLTFDRDIEVMFRYSVILAVAAIPEGLPIAVTVILSLGMRRILKRQGLVRHLMSVETLGSTSVICTDKTGTLTEGIMKVTKTHFANHREAIIGLVMLNTGRSSLEVALWKYLSNELGYDPGKLADSFSVLHEEVFESDKKYAKTLVNDHHQTKSYVIGAPEVIIKFCLLSQKKKQSIMDELNLWAGSGLRVVGLAYKKTSSASDKRGYSWCGLIGVRDPVRPTVANSIKDALKAGINVKIVTGDYLQTAINVARQVGLQVTSRNTIEGAQLETLTTTQLKNQIDDLIVFARVQPIQKLKIIEALQAKGEVVAMTGDGVNDAPALKKADIGIAVGNATDVAKAASDVILLDSNFTTIVSSIEEGRVIFANIKKMIGYILSNSLVEVVLISGAILSGLPLPLTIVQILWIHLICDGPPDIVLGFEPKEDGIMSEKPREYGKTRLLDTPMLLLILIISFTTGMLALLAFYIELQSQSIYAQTLAFAVVGSIDLIYIFAYKDLKKPLLKIKLLNNPYLLGAVIYGFILLLGGIYLPQANQLLGTRPLQAHHWIYPALASLLTLLWVELVKKASLKRVQKAI